MTTDYVHRREMELVLRLLTPANELAVRVALHTGLRIGDVLALRPPPKRRLWIVEQKTRRRRRVDLTRELVSELEASAGALWLFPGRDPRKHRTRQAVWADLKRAQRALRLPMCVGTHSARKIYAVEQLRKHNGELAAVQRRLGHTDAATTAVYAMAEALYQAHYEDGPDGRPRRRKRV